MVLWNQFYLIGTIFHYYRFHLSYGFDLNIAENEHKLAKSCTYFAFKNCFLIGDRTLRNKERKNIGIYYRSTCSQCVYKFSTSRAARPLGFGVMGRHHSAFEANLSQQYRRAWGQTIGAGFGSRIGLKSHNFKGIDNMTSVALTRTLNSNQSNKQSLSIATKT